MGTITAKHSVSSEQAYALPDPGGPAVTAVTEESFANGVEQTIFLQTDTAEPGENSLRVQFFGPTDWRTAGQTSLRSGFLPPTQIAGEMRRALPGVAMRRSTAFVQNRYGPFGYAMGRGREGDPCIYAWQALNSNAKRKKILRDKGAIQVRLRYCRKGATESSLLALMYNYSVNAFFFDETWNPLGDPAPAPVGPHEIVYPVGVRGLEAVLPEAPAQATPARRVRRSTASAAPQRPAPLPATVGPVVPSPNFAAAALAPGAVPASVASPKVPGPPLAAPAAAFPAPGGTVAAKVVVPPPPAAAASGTACPADARGTASGCRAN